MYARAKTSKYILKIASQSFLTCVITWEHIQTQQRNVLHINDIRVSANTYPKSHICTQTNTRLHEFIYAVIYIRRDTQKIKYIALSI